ncbi:MAG TPA: hypothetical protein VN702_23740 [Acetobacteraceae bacterium]|nr:hypothetical protein [Acetobacteraceae bacterium]
MPENNGSATSLPAALRTLRVGVDDESRIRRTVHLAAAKIEDLEARVSSLTAALTGVSTGAAPSPRTPG